MKAVRLYGILLAGLLLFSCGQKDIVLDVVRHPPNYIKNEGLFGEDIKSMEEKNTFIVETGKIDTTDEVPPLEIALINVQKKTTQLELTARAIDGNSTIETYSGSGFVLTIIGETAKKTGTGNYAKAKLTITKGKQRSDYRVYRKTGYF